MRDYKTEHNRRKQRREIFSRIYVYYIGYCDSEFGRIWERKLSDFPSEFMGIAEFLAFNPDVVDLCWHVPYGKNHVEEHLLKLKGL